MEGLPGHVRFLLVKLSTWKVDVLDILKTHKRESPVSKFTVYCLSSTILLYYSQGQCLDGA